LSPHLWVHIDSSFVIVQQDKGRQCRCPGVRCQGANPKISILETSGCVSYACGSKSNPSLPRSGGSLPASLVGMSGQGISLEGLAPSSMCILEPGYKPPDQTMPRFCA